MDKKGIYILSGIPGCGKSTTASKLANTNRSVIVSADDFFVNKHTGEYKFDIRQIAVAHSICMSNFLLALNDVNIDTIVVDNTNIRLYEIRNYYLAAKLINCEINIICFVVTDSIDIKDCHSRNIHRVPLETIISMSLSHEHDRFSNEFGDIVTFR